MNIPDGRPVAGQGALSRGIGGFRDFRKKLRQGVMVDRRRYVILGSLTNPAIESDTREFLTFHGRADGIGSRDRCLMAAHAL